MKEPTLLVDFLRWGGRHALGPGAMAELKALLDVERASRAYAENTVGGNHWRWLKAIEALDAVRARNRGLPVSANRAQMPSQPTPNPERRG